MGMGWEKLFKNNPTPANDSRALAIRYESAEEAPLPIPAPSSPVWAPLRPPIRAEMEKRSR
jgi:hypothetical protein